ncbi:MAG: hypothetical protein ABIW33_03055 [Sphingomicrobium sp.]
MTIQTTIITLLVAVVAIIVALGWRSPDRSPGVDTEAERKRIED